MTRNPGSDCPTGKEQFTRDAAAKQMGWARAQGWQVSKYRCMLCDCYHLGNRRRADKKASIQRRR